MSFWTMRLNQQVQGTASNQLVMAMHLLTGQIGRPGATPFSLTGQPNAGGGVRDTGALAHALPNGRAVANPEHRHEMEQLWNIPEGTISPDPGYHVMDPFVNDLFDSGGLSIIPDEELNQILEFVNVIQ